MAATATLSPSVWEALRPAPRVSTWDWICQYGRSPDGTDRFDALQVPYFREVCDQFDSPHVRYLVLVWASRLGKTLGVHNVSLSFAARDPQQMILASPVQAITQNQIHTKLYKMAERCHPLRDRLPRERLRTRNAFQFGSDLEIMHGVWAGSVSQLADRGVRYIDLQEADKYPSADREEGDTFAQIMKRTGEYGDFKIWISGTPQRRAGSRLEQWLSRGSNSRYLVPCSHCGEYRKLRFNLDGPTSTGLVFDPLESGAWDRDKAAETARYVCDVCEHAWSESDRWRAIDAGRWAPRGCTVTPDGELSGTPIYRGRSIWSSRLSALYSKAMSLARLAAEWVDQRSTPAGRRAFSQLALAKGHEPEITQLEPAALGERIGTNDRRGTCPSWSRLLVTTADVQKSCVKFTAWAVGERMRTHLVDYGEAKDLNEFASVFVRPLPVEGGGELLPRAVGIDSGYQTEAVYAFCQKFDTHSARVVPIKGSDNDLAGQPWKESRLGVDSKARRSASREHIGQLLLSLNTDHWEEMLHAALCDLSPAKDGKPFDDGYTTLCDEAAEDFAFCEELLNGSKDDSVTDKRGNERKLWVKRWTDKRNDYRDCGKMALCLIDWWLTKRGNRLPPPIQRRANDERAKPATSPRPMAPIGARPRGWIGSAPVG